MATIAPLGVYQAFDDNGDPLVGGKLFTYLAGTTAPKATFTDAGGMVSNTNPVILDASGMANVWLGDGGYKFKLEDADGNLIFTVDDIGGTTDTAFGAQVNMINSNTIINTTYKNSANIVTNSPTLSLLPAPSAGQGFYFTVKNQGSGTVVLDPDGGELIDGAATKSIGPGQSALIITNGIAWYSFFLSTVSNTGDNSFTGNNSFSGNTAFTGNVIFPDEGGLTIVSGSITVTGVNHTVDTEGAAASDNLDTINGGVDGQILILRTEDNARDVVITQAGNIATGGGANITLGNSLDQIELKYDGEKAKWLVLSATAAQGAKADTALQPGAQTIFLGASQAATSGTFIDFTAIPAGVKRITINFLGVSMNASADWIIQLGDSGGIENTGYTSAGGRAAASSTTATTGIVFNNAADASGNNYGWFVLELINPATFQWSGMGVINQNTANSSSQGGGSKSLSAELDRIRITTVAGTATFDAGSINITYSF